VSYNHELIDSMRSVCKSSTKEENERLYQLLPNPEARSQLIVNNMPLVVSIVDGYLKRFPALENERDDLTSEGFLGLTEAVDALLRASTPVANVTGYLGQSIEYHLGHLAARHKRQVPTQQSDVDYSKRSLSTIDSIERVDVEDLLRHSCETAFEWNLIQLRRQGYTDREIANQYGISHSTVVRCLGVIKARFNQVTNPSPRLS
jgi:RNA polymerase sigma factor (sigma-70 family)